ncbi:MAG TPA: hypothetical protein VGN72_01180 [Tepidisphaeraceae bacterium]|jgi:hypothetical protein|nr:hypothetical protein [Tepidisphaeraceae bacterium]
MSNATPDNPAGVEVGNRWCRWFGHRWTSLVDNYRVVERRSTINHDEHWIKIGYTATCDRVGRRCRRCGCEEMFQTVQPGANHEQP